MIMSDLIDREALLRQIDIDSEGEPGYYGDTWKFIDTIKSMPPVELGTNLAEVGTDCISRQAAIDIAKDLTITVEGYEMHNQAVMNYCADIMQLPPIQPKRGRWHYSDGKPARIGLSFGVVCDQCGTGSEYCTNFCGECGADMRQREE